VLSLMKEDWSSAEAEAARRVEDYRF
jgi:hypothetical protein